MSVSLFANKISCQLASQYTNIEQVSIGNKFRSLGHSSRPIKNAIDLLKTASQKNIRTNLSLPVFQS